MTVCPVIGSLIPKEGAAAPGVAFISDRETDDQVVLDSDEMDGMSEEDLLLANAFKATTK